MSARYLLVGLGNPGREYVNTRHNAGFWLIDSFVGGRNFELIHKAKMAGYVGQVEVNGDSWVVLKPATYMNRSGVAVRKVSQYFDVTVENILVAHDELDFEPGIIRFKRGGGHGGHNGLRDIIAQLGDSGFSRLRVGIGRSGEMASYVLKPPSKYQRADIDSAIVKVSQLLPGLVGERSQQAIQELHA